MERFKNTLCQRCLNANKAVTAVVRCTDCDQLLCTDCKRVHSSQESTQSHTLVVKRSVVNYPTHAKITKPCGSCQEDHREAIAVLHCQQCDENFCEGCSKAHKVQKVTKTHQLIDIATMVQERTVVNHPTNAKITKSCDPCQEGHREAIAVLHCQQCDENFYEGCSKAHKTQKATKTHQLVDVATLALASDRIAKISYCDQCLETGKHIRGIKACLNCYIALCGKCLEKHDQTHTFCEVSGTEERQEATAITCHMNAREQKLVTNSSLARKRLPHDHTQEQEQSQHLVHEQMESRTVVNQPTNAKITKPCDPCQEDHREAIAVLHCQQCDENFSKGCSKAHKTQKATNTHQLIDISTTVQERSVVNYPTHAKITKPCGSCQEDHREAIAVLHCQQCDENFCEGCSKAHKVQKVTKTHQLIDIATMVQERTVVNHPTNAKITKSCDPCQEDHREAIAVLHCQQCDENFYEGCSKAHKTQKATKTHQLVDVATLALASDRIAKISYCDQCLETGKHIRGIKACLNCYIALCGKCLEKHDQTHTFCEVSGTEERQEATAITCHMNAREQKLVTNSSLARKRLPHDHTQEQEQSQHLVHEQMESRTVVNQPTNAKITKPCDPCQEDHREAIAVLHCQQCDENFCEGCSKAHKTQKATNTHQLIDISTTVQERSVVNYPTHAKITKPCGSCQEDHREAIAVLHCQQCDENFCEGCSKAHKVQKVTKTHQLIDIATMVQERTVVNHPTNAKITKSCDPCQEDHREAIAVLHCQQCDENFYEGCSKAHKTQKATKTHQLVDVATLALASDRIAKISYCYQCLETGKRIRGIKACLNCNIALCGKCLEKHDQTHTFCEVSGIEERQEATALTCHMCKHNGRSKLATEHCTVCKESLCDGCSNIHKSGKQSKPHKIIKLDSIDYKLCEHCLGKGKTVLVYTDNIRNDNPLCCSCSARIPERANAREQKLVTNSSLARKRLPHDHTQEQEQSQHLVHEQMESRNPELQEVNERMLLQIEHARKKKEIESSYTIEEAIEEAMSSLASLQEKVEKSVEDTENIRNAIDSLRKHVTSQTEEVNKYIKGAQSVVSVAKSIVDNFDKFTSGNALEIVSGTISMIGTIGGVVGGPFGPLIAGVCGVIASILPLFGGKKGPSMSEVVDNVIREALDDFRDEAIYVKVIDSLNTMTAHIAQLVGIATHNAGHLSDEEKGFLTTTDFTTVGTSALAALQVQIEKYKSIENDENKSQRITKYVYYYCMVSIQRTVIMNLHCSLLRINDMEAIFAGVKEYLFKVLPKKDRNVLEFMSMLPSSKNWWMLYRCLHTTLTAQQRGILSAYTKQIGCPPMIGKLCYLYNDVQNEYMYLPNNDYCKDGSRRYVFTWRRKTCDDSQFLFRLIGDKNNCRIFNVYFGEYIYADEKAYDSKSTRVFSWRPGSPSNRCDWEISGTTIRNCSKKEYMYAADTGKGADRRYVFTKSWQPGEKPVQGDWTVIEVSFENDDLNNGLKKVAV